MNNPYAAPTHDETVESLESKNIVAIAAAQKMIIYSILAYFGFIVLNITGLGLLGLPLVLAALIMGLIGTVRLATSLGNSTVMIIIYVVLMFIPLVGLIVLVMLNGRATKILRENGYTVGLLGASKN